MSETRGWVGPSGLDTATIPKGLGLELPPMLQTPTELGMVIGVTEQNLGRSPRSVLEIGVWEGGTISRFVSRWPEAIVLGVDPAPRGDVQAWAPVIEGLSQDDSTREEVERRTPESGWEFVHIDGDHSYEAALADYRWAVDVLEARIVALHDIAPFDHGGMDVWRLWHEIKLGEHGRGVPVEIRHNAGGIHGYGLVIVRG